MSGDLPAAFAVTPVTPGDWVGRYELLYPAAQGGMGSVWAARVRGMSVFERLFAVKMVLPQFAAEPSFREMFLDEARIASRIVHPNVAPVIDIGEHQGGLYLVMEWIEGDSIHLMSRAATKRNTKLPLPVVLRVVADACGGLHAAHELRDNAGVLLDVVHRDISPQNLLVSSDGATKLIDFGVAKARGRLHGETAAGFLKGKLKFMAPEQASGKHVDRRADVFAMGAVLFFLLTGEFAYDGPNDASTLHALLGGKPRRPLPPTVDPVVRALVDRSMQREPEKRYQNASDLRDALESAIATLGLRATTSAVQECYLGLMGDRVAGRARSLELAVRSVEERARVREILERQVSPDATGSGSGTGRPSVGSEVRTRESPAGAQEMFQPVPGAGDRPTNPEPFVVRTAAEFNASYHNLLTRAARRRRIIVGTSIAVLAIGVGAAGFAMLRAMPGGKGALPASNSKRSPGAPPSGGNDEGHADEAAPPAVVATPVAVPSAPPAATALPSLSPPPPAPPPAPRVPRRVAPSSDAPRVKPAVRADPTESATESRK